MQKSEQDITFKSLFLPFTTKKAIVFILSIGLIVFFNSLFGNFVWDDIAFIVNNSDIHNFSLAKIFGLSFFNKDGFYRSIPAAYYSLLYLFFQKSVFFYHLPQVLLHIINSIIVLKILMKFMDKKISFLLTLIFLVHPINVESTAYIGAASGTIYSFFGLSSLLLSLNNHLTKKSYIAIFLLLLFSLLTKEEAILYFVLILLFCLLFQRKWFKNLFICEIFSFLAYLLIRIVYGKVYFIGFGENLLSKGATVTNGRFIPIMHLGLLERLSNIPQIFFYYLKILFYPLNLAVDQIWVIKKIDLNTFYLPFIIDLLFIIALIVIGKKVFEINRKDFKPYIFFFCWFALGLLMHLQIIPLDMTVADRWFYPSMIGLLGMTGLMLQNFPHDLRINKVITSVLITILILLSLITINRNSNFYNEISLYTHDSQIADNYEIEINLGSAYYAIDDSRNAITHYKKSVDLLPYEGNFVSLGNVYAKMGNINLAKKYFLKAYASKSFMRQKHLFITYSGLGWTYLLTNDPQNAKKVLELGLKEYPDSKDIWLPLAVSYHELNMQKEAVATARKLKIMDPNDLTNYIYTYVKTKQGP